MASQILKRGERQILKVVSITGALGMLAGIALTSAVVYFAAMTLMFFGAGVLTMDHLEARFGLGLVLRGRSSLVQKLGNARV